MCALGQVCLIALGVVSRWVRYLVLVTFWGAVLELLSHLQQASPRGPSCLLNQSRPPVIRGPMHYSMQGSWTAGSKIPPAVAPRIGGLGRTGCLQLGPTVPQLPVHAHRYKQRVQQDVSTFLHVPCLIRDNHPQDDLYEDTVAFDRMEYLPMECLANYVPGLLFL